MGDFFNTCSGLLRKPELYKPVFTLHSKECTRIDSWCYFCQAYDDLDRPILNGEEGGLF